MPQKKKNENNLPVDFELLFKSVNDLYLVLDPNLMIVAASDAYLATTMIKREDVLGKYVFDIFPDNPNQPEKESINVRNSFKRVLQKKIPDTIALVKYDIRSSATGKFEEHFWSVVNSPVIKDDKVNYILHRAEDVTDFVRLKQQGITLNQVTEQQKFHLEEMERAILKRTQEIQNAHKRLRESEEHFRLMVEGTKDYAILMLDPTGHIKTWNAGAERIKGYKAEEIIGKHFSAFYTQEARDSKYPDYELKKAIEDGRYEEEGWRVRKDGSQFWADVIITPIYDEKANLIGFGKVTRDLTEHKKIEILKNEFVSVVSHELRTPLTSIRGSLSLILGGAAGEVTEKVKTLLNIADNNCERLIKLINDILDIEKIEAGKMNFKFKRHDIGNLIKEAVALNEMYAEKYNVKLICPEIYSGIFVYVDADRLMQVISNLISNAVKFSPRGGEVAISMTLRDNCIRISVSDQGPGIPEEFKNKIFQKFSQVDSSSTRLKGGTGLGLAISKAIIERLDGQLNFVSKLNQGTTFYFDLPIIQEKNNNKEMPPKPVVLNGKRILICEDDKEQADYICNLLQGAGYESDIGYSGAQTKELLQEREYTALLLDLVLPDMNGIQLIQEIRNKERNNIPIIVISAMAKEGKALMNGSAVEVIDWLDKPIDFNKLSKAFTRIKEKTKIKKPTILHIEDDVDTQNVIKNLLMDRSAIIDGVASIQDAKNALSKKKYDLVILDLVLPDGNGAELLPTIATYGIPVIIFALGELDPKYAHYVKEVLVKPKTSPQKLVETMKKLLEARD